MLRTIPRADAMEFLSKLISLARPIELVSLSHRRLRPYQRNSPIAYAAKASAASPNANQPSQPSPPPLRTVAVYRPVDAASAVSVPCASPR